MAAKCRVCKRVRPQEAIAMLNPTCMAYDCQVAFADKSIAKKRKDDDKAFRAETAKMKSAAKKRTGKGGYYESLKIALHKYVKHVLLRGQPCYTCGLEQKFTDSGGKFHVGHFMPAKMADPRRFMLENLKMQCYGCNALNSGRQKEYRIKLIEDNGIEFVEWLECDSNHKSLEERYPTTDDISAEASKYRALYNEGMRELDRQV